VHLGAVALNPGAVVPVGTRVGINWSGCFGDASTVPAVTGFTFSAARHALHAVGLSWACYSAGTATTTSTKPPTTTTTVKTPQTVLTQIPAAGTVLHPGATVSLIMHHCPQ
jgi:beta-lactam-binding protein with PASTA domain